MAQTHFLRVGHLAAMSAFCLATTVTAMTQDRQPAAPNAVHRRLLVEAAGGAHLSYVGNTVSLAFGLAPTRRTTLLASVERSHVRPKIDYFPDGYAAERGGTDTWVSIEARYAFWADRQVSPYLVGGAGRGRSHPTVNAIFPNPNDRNIQVIYYGAGARLPVGARFDAFVDARVIFALEAASDYFGVRIPVRGGLAWRF